MWRRASHRKSRLSKREVETWNPGPYQSWTVTPPPRLRSKIVNWIWNGFCSPDCLSFRIVEMFDLSNSKPFEFLISCIFSLWFFWGRICRCAFSLQQKLLTALGWEQGLSSYPNEGRANHCESGQRKLEVETRIPRPNQSWIIAPLSILDFRAPSPTKIENRELNLEWVLFARLFEFSDCRSVRSFEFQTFRILDFLHFFFMIFLGRICRSAFFLQQKLLTALGWEQGLSSYPDEGRANHCESGPSKLEVGTRIPGPNQSWIITPPPPTKIKNREPDLECFLGSWLREFSKLSEFSTFRISYLSILWCLAFFLF